MALPLTGLVSQLEPSLQGLLMQASSRWHSKPVGNSTMLGMQLTVHEDLGGRRGTPEELQPA